MRRLHKDEAVGEEQVMVQVVLRLKGQSRYSQVGRRVMVVHRQSRIGEWSIAGICIAWRFGRVHLECIIRHCKRVKSKCEVHRQIQSSSGASMHVHAMLGKSDFQIWSSVLLSGIWLSWDSSPDLDVSFAPRQVDRLQLATWLLVSCNFGCLQYTRAQDRDADLLHRRGDLVHSDASPAL